MAVNVTALIGDSEIIATGAAIMKATQTLTLRVTDLTFKLSYVDDGGEQKVETAQPDDRSLTVTLRNFNNSLGTTWSGARVGYVAGAPLWLSAYVEAVGDVKVLSYTLCLGGNLG